MSEFTIVVSCASGIESVLKTELMKLGYRNLKANDGKIKITGNETDIASLNIGLRTAERIYIQLQEFTATSFDELFDNIYSYNWGEILPFNAKILINGKSKNSKLFSLRDCQKIIKRSILKKLETRYGKKVFPESGEEYSIIFSINNDCVSILLDTSGTPLHKRGYRNFVYTAPIKETLAASMILLSDFDPNLPFADPFCGSGTIGIEAALIAKNIAPNINRTFAFERWNFFNYEAKSIALEKAKDLINNNIKPTILCSDINKEAIRLTNIHAKNAGVDKDITVYNLDATKFTSNLPNGCIVTNPPYGDRLLTESETQKLYKDFGKQFKALDNWSLYIISSNPIFEKSFGYKCDKNRKLYNAEKQCYFYQYFKKH
ncbi:MAG: class I SAM-dependent RNA methyltransferase [Clostridia bacterium]|nr:class I SAM-dependent RNA methyltransferase [Clostridia bacterium]